MAAILTVCGFLAWATDGMAQEPKLPPDSPRGGFPIQWHGSHRLAALGLRDAYRTRFPDEVAKPGITWTPPYPVGTPGRRPPGDQVLERIDLIYFAGPGVELVDAAVVGENAAHCEIVFPKAWPSDHRAVLARFRVRAEAVEKK